ncbi:hypothetical protein Tco_1147385 [Tanacetum coccineum]
MSCVLNIRSPDTREQSGQPVMTREEDDRISVALDPQTLSSGFCVSTKSEVVILGGTTLAEVILGDASEGLLVGLDIRNQNACWNGYLRKGRKTKPKRQKHDRGMKRGLKAKSKSKPKCRKVNPSQPRSQKVKKNKFRD